MSTIEEFISAHVQEPWPKVSGLDPDAPAGELYARFKSEWHGEGRCLSHVEFGTGIRAAGIEPERLPEGIFYPRLSVASREERADRAVLTMFRRWERSSMTLRLREDHVARKHADGSQCAHEVPEAVLDAELDAHLERTGLMPFAKERLYGPWLRWRPGQPSPDLLDYWYERDQRMAELRRIIPVAEADAATARAVVGAMPEALPGGALMALLRGDSPVSAAHDVWCEREAVALAAERYVADLHAEREATALSLAATRAEIEAVLHPVAVPTSAEGSDQSDW